MAEPNYEFLLNQLRSLPILWDGKKCILELKEANYHWRQMEWIGFYFEYLCRKNLSDTLEIPGPRYGKVSFDAFWYFPWDFKAHVVHNIAGKPQPVCIINDQEAVIQAIGEYGKTNLIIASGCANYNDVDHSFRKWHQALKGGPSKYVKDREKRGKNPRLRKVSFHVNKYGIYELNASVLERLGIYKQGINSNLKSRRPKFRMNLNNHEPILELKNS